MRNGNDVGKSAEDYLESMVILKEKNGYIRSVDIAEYLGVTKPSVSNAMKRLREENYIEMNRSGFITLTEFISKYVEDMASLVNKNHLSKIRKLRVF